MELTLKERVVLANQFRILEALYPDEAEAFSNHRKALENGYSHQYSWIVQYFDQNEMSEEECKEVRDILDMHRALKRSYERLQDTEGVSEDDIKFRGFDGNNESRLFGYTDYIINDLGRYEEQRDSSLNSHMPSIARYRMMLTEWNECEDKYSLGREDILRMVKT